MFCYKEQHLSHLRAHPEEQLAQWLDAHAAGLILQNALQQTGCPSVKALAERLDIRLGEIGPQGHLSCSSAKKKPSPRTSRGSKSTTHFSKRSGSI